MTQRSLPMISFVTSTLVCFTILALINHAECWWNCHQDACNVDEVEQYCSETERKCINCSEIVNRCWTKDMPLNCTKTCGEHIREQERASPCPVLGDIENGHRSQEISDISRPGDIVHFSCDPGFKLEGSADVTCMACGQWSATIPVCEEMTCPELPVVLNGQWSTVPKQTFSTGHTISFLCNAGFMLEGSSVWNCSGGTWVSTLAFSEHIPVCTKGVSIVVYIAVTAVITAIGTFFILAVVWWYRQRQIKSKYNRVCTQEPGYITVSLDKEKKTPMSNLVGYKNKDEKLKITDKPCQRENEGVMGNKNNPRRSGEQPQNDAGSGRGNDKANTATKSNSVNNILNISINNNQSSQVNMCYSKSNAGNMSDTRRPPDNSAPFENDQINEETMPQQQETDLKFPVTESQHSTAGPKCVPPVDHKNVAGGGQTGFVQQQGTEQDLNQKMTLGGTEVHLGDQNGANNAPDDVIPKQKMVAS